MMGGRGVVHPVVPPEVAATADGGDTVELAAAKKPKEGPGGTEVEGDGLTYDPATRSFHPTTKAEGDFNSKHPRGAKGTHSGGKFAKKQQAQTAAAQKKQASDQKKQTAAQAAAAKKVIAAAAKAARAKTAADKKRAAAELRAARAQVVAANKAAKAAKAATPKAPKVAAPKAKKAPAAPKVAAPKAAKAPAAPKAAAKPTVTPPAPPAKTGPAPMTSMGFAVDSMEKATVHSPIGKPGGPGLWHHKGKQLPAYIQHVAKALMKGGMAESHAIATAVNTIKRWAAGGGDVHPDTRAAAAKALAEWEAAKAETHLAVQTGSVPVRSSGDGPRVTGNTTAKGAFLVAYTRGRRRRARSRRSMAIEASSPGHCDSVECLTAKDPVCTCECGGVGHMKGIGALGHPSKQKRPLKATVVTKPEKKAPPPDPWSDPEGASKGLSPGSWGGDDPMAQDAAFEAWAAKSQVAAAKEKIKAAKAPKLEAIAKKAPVKKQKASKVGAPTPTDAAKAEQVAALPASHNLTEAEVMAHYKATVSATHGEKMALDSYTGSGYANMNRKLRSGKIDEMTAQEKGRMFELDNLAAKYTLPATTKVSRGISSQYFTKETLAPGSIYTDPGFVSTSHSTEFGGIIKFKITVPKGMKAISVNAHGVGIHSEHELILPRGTKFAVTSDTGYTGGSYRTIHMTAIPA